jgi:hypothetical protein
MIAERVPVAPVRWVCPFNGQPTECMKCHRTTPHHAEEWVSPLVRPPMCQTHGEPMVRVLT